jgi:hypothetical protein
LPEHIVFEKYTTGTNSSSLQEFIANTGLSFAIGPVGQPSYRFCILGVPEDKIVEAHGSFREGYCTGCRQRYSLAWLRREIFQPETNQGVPKCHTCQGKHLPSTGIMCGFVIITGSNKLSTRPAWLLSIPVPFRGLTESITRAVRIQIVGSSIGRGRIFVNPWV